VSGALSKILAHKWRTSHRPLDASLDSAEDTVKTYCFLHSFVCEQYGYNLDTSSVGISNDMQVVPLQGRRNANNIRDQYASYFMTDYDQVCWQLNKS
jgi:hypothetical protein